MLHTEKYRPRSITKNGTAAVIASRYQLLIVVNISLIRKEVQHLVFFKGINIDSSTLLLVSVGTESSLGARNFIQKHIVKIRGRCRELLTNKEKSPIVHHHVTYWCILEGTDLAASVKTCPTRVFLRREPRASPFCAKYHQAFLPYISNLVTGSYTLNNFQLKQFLSPCRLYF